MSDASIAQWPGKARVAVQFVLNYGEGGENSVPHVPAHDRVWVTRRIDIARHWKAQFPFDAATAFVWE
ncbi:hypothetical protein ACVBEH_01965 [Roseateles sp. GG27B]